MRALAVAVLLAIVVFLVRRARAEDQLKRRVREARERDQRARRGIELN